MLPMPGHDGLVQQRPLELGPAAAQRGDGGVEVEQRVHRVAGDVRDRLRAAARRRRPGPAGAPTARRTCAGRRTAAPGRRRRSGTGPAGASRPGARGPRRASGRSCPRWASTASSPASCSSRSSQRYLPRRRAAVMRAPGQPGREVGAARDVPPDRTRMTDLDGRDGAVQHVVGETAADDLDLGELRHRAARRSATVAGRRARRGTLRRQRAPGQLGGLLLGFLLRAARARAQVRPPTTAVAVNTLRWSGPSSAIRYSGTPWPWRRGELLQARLPVQTGAEQRRAAQQLVEQAVDQLARRSPGRARGTPRRSAPRWRRPGCWPSTGRRSAPRRGPGTGRRPGRPRPTSSAATPASACMFTTLARSFAS